MVSGFFTSPCDHSRIFSGDASEIRIAENDSGSFGFSKKLKMSFTFSPFSSLSGTVQNQKLLLAAELARGRRRRARSRGGRAGLCRDLSRHQLQRRLLLAGGIRILDQLHVQAERLKLLEEHV